MLLPKHRNTFITIFVLIWLFLFYYESLRYNYLCPFFCRQLPKCKFLFPPAGWIMFFQVGPTEVYCEVYGQKADRLELIDPHKIFPNRWLGYDNIHRNVLITVLDPDYAWSFCQYLKRKFPEYEYFAIAEAIYPSPAQYKDKKILKLAYKC